MASPEVAYRKPTASDRTKSSRSPFTVEDQVAQSTLPPRLRNTLQAMLKFNRFGTELWPATLAVRIEADVSYRTVQRHIDLLVKRKVLEEVFPANTLIRGRGFRRSATYRLNAAALTPRMTWRQWRDSKAEVVPFRPMKPEPVKEQKPVETAKQSSAGSRKLRQLTSRERSHLVKTITSLMHGYTRHVGPDRLGVNLDPSDPRYVAPMDQWDALAEACKQLAIPIESAIDALKLAGWAIEKGEA